MQQQSCKRQTISDHANRAGMDGLESDAAFVAELVRWSKTPPSKLAREAGLAATTLLRPYKRTATTRISQPTFDKLRKRYPEFPGWRTEAPDQVSMYGERTNPDEQTDELVYIKRLDIALAMGDAVVVEDHPAMELIPFNLGFIKGITRADTERLVVVTGQGDSMEPTLLRSDMLLIDTTQRTPSISDLIWAFLYAGGGMVKRLRRVRHDGRDQFMIVSDNPSIPSQHADPEDVHILGKVIWIGRVM